MSWVRLRWNHSMSRCPITYTEIQKGLYSPEGLRRLDPRLKDLRPLEYSKEELLEEAAARSGKISLEGVQPKLSAVLSVRDSKFVLADTNGRYVIKPQQTVYPEVPENEDLTMRLADIAGIEVPVHGLLYDKTGTLHYCIRRFDRHGRNKKFAVEDFAQLTGKNRDTKYDSSMEKVAEVLDAYCSFPAIEKAKLFKITLFNFLTGNEDMHLKNYSLITREHVTMLSPAYDLLNTTIAVKKAYEEIALPLHGKKRNLTKTDFIRYWGKERLKLNDPTIESVMRDLQNALPRFVSLITISFLSAPLKSRYQQLLETRSRTLGLTL